MGEETEDVAGAPKLKFDAAVEAASQHYRADIYLYSGQVNDVGLGKIVEAVTSHKRLDNAVLIITTTGGSANSAYSIARIFQKMYKNFTVYCPSYCKSAGTLLALGAHELLMDMFSELGPLDVQLYCNYIKPMRSDYENQGCCRNLRLTP